MKHKRLIVFSSKNQILLCLGNSHSIPSGGEEGPVIDDVTSLLLTMDGLDDPVQLSHWRVVDNHLRIKLPESVPNWFPDQPTMVRLKGQLVLNRQTLLIDQPFAHRWFETKNGKIYLNDQPIYLRGAIRGITAHDSLNLTGGTKRQWHEKLIHQAKAFGFNLIRWHSTVPDDEWLTLCDQFGLLNQIEMGFDKDGDDIHVDTEQWVKIIRQTASHPSAAIYSVGNEIRRAGSYPHVQELVRLAKTLNPGALVTDSTGWGQPDRPNPDLYIQHIAYFFPYAEHADMFERLEGFELEGYTQSPPPDADQPGTPRQPLKPTLAHEVCHYIAIRDVDRIQRKWQSWQQTVNPPCDHPAANLPWWVDGLRELARSKGLLEELEELRSASEHFQEIAQRFMLERIRLASRLEGFEMLQLLDCWKYENSNAPLDAFGDPIHWKAEDFRLFNDDTVLLVDSDSRTARAGETLCMPVKLSHYARHNIHKPILTATVDCQAKKTDIYRVSLPGTLRPGNLHDLPTIEWPVPQVQQPCSANVEITLQDAEKTYRTHYEYWLMPAVSKMNESRIIHDVDESTLKEIAKGDNRLWLYKPSHCFDRSQNRPSLDWTASPDLFKPCIWDRGHNLGAVIHSHPVLDKLPHKGWLGWPYARLVHHGCKINLDSFPVSIHPMIQGIDRPVRDRMDVKKRGKKQYVEDYTFRRWGWLFELAVGDGRMIVCGFNFDHADPLGDWLLNELATYLDKPTAPPSATIDSEIFIEYLQKQRQIPPQQEPPMTEYWQRDIEPVESILFWEELGIKLQ